MSAAQGRASIDPVDAVMHSEPLAVVPPSPKQTLMEWRDGLPTLSCSTLTLREPRPDDAPSLFEHLANEEVSRFMSRPPTRATGFERFILWMQGERQVGRCLCFAIVPAGTDQAAGLIQVRQLEPGFGSAEWGFALGQRFWGTGLFRAASTAVVDFVFRHVGAYRLEARSTPSNDRGNGALRRLGADPEGVLRKSLVGVDQPMDQLLWSMHADDWLAAHAEPNYSLAWSNMERTADRPPPPGAAAANLPAWRVELPVFPTPLCLLRELETRDAPSLLNRLSHPDVVRFIPPSPANVEEFEQFIGWARRQRLAGRYACFAVVPAGRDEAIGIFQLRQLDPSFKTAEWGFVLAKEYWGTGTFLSGAVAVLNFAFDTIGVHRLEARAATGNDRGNGALRKVGATLEGQLRRSFLLAGVYHDDALWALLAEDWRRLREGVV